MELVCPAGNLPSLKAAVDNGADAVYVGFRDQTNARHFPGLNFTAADMEDGIDYAHRRGARVFLALNTYPRASGWRRWTDAVDLAADIGIDTLIIADMGILGYASAHWPDLPRHLSVQGSATNLQSLKFYHEEFGIRRAVLPRVLSLAQVRRLAERSPVELEVFGFGSLCIMVEGRCQLSSYVTGQSPNTGGACSPAKSVRWKETDDGTLESRLNGVLIDRFVEGENAGYPTLCKGRFNVGGERTHALEEPTSLNTLALLPDLKRAGVAAVKIEGRQRSPSYVANVTGVWRDAIDAVERDPDGYTTAVDWDRTLAALSEGSQTTLGAYDRPWQ